MLSLALLSVTNLAACNRSSQSTLPESSEPVPAASADAANITKLENNSTTNKTDSGAPSKLSQADAPSNGQGSSTRPTNERIRFAPGTSSSITENAVVRGEENTYLINAGKGQTMNIRITALEDNAVFSVVSPSGKVIATETTTLNQTLPETGDYQIAVVGTRGNASYKMTTEIRSDRATPPPTLSKPTNQRIRFAPGTSSTTVKNAVVRAERNTYLINAGKGQTMNISITALENNAVFELISPNGTVMAAEATSISETLPATGDYQISVGGTRGNASYEMTIAIK